MMKTKVIATTLLLCSIVFFSGCGPKYLPCKAEEPVRTYTKNCTYEGNMTKLSKCAAEKYTVLEGDYEVLLTRFRSCK